MTKISCSSSVCLHTATRQSSIRRASFSTGKSTVTRSLEGTVLISMRSLVFDSPNKESYSFRLATVDLKICRRIA